MPAPKTPRKRVPKVVTDAVAEAVQSDPEILERARSLGLQAMDEAARIFKEGHSSDKAALTRVLLPAMLKPDKAEEDEERVRLRADLEALYEEAGLRQK